jgi:threonine aldolase
MSRAVHELRSDTFTRPTEAMRRAMYESEVGDDVWHEDPTVHRLEARAAELTGKEAALFVSSGTQGNLIGLLSHTEQGNEVILGDQSHIVWYEVGGAAVVGGLQFRTLPNRRDGRLRPDEVAGAMRLPPDIHFPRTGCVAVENTHNRCSGAVIPPDEIAAVSAVAHAADVPVHMDGARVFNAAVALRVPVSALTGPVDSVTFCLSKGLGAPVGSVLCGSRDYIERAHRWRKLLGGGMRQVGVLAAAGLVALDQQIERLADDHANARALAVGLAEIDGIDIDVDSIQSNIVAFDLAEPVDPEAFLVRAADAGVLLGRVAGTPRSVRAVTCYEIDRSGIDEALVALRHVVADLAPSLV